ANLGKPVKRGFPLAAPPPTHPGLAGSEASGSQPAHAPGPSPTVPLRIAPPGPPGDALTPSGELVLPPPPVPPSGPRAMPGTTSGPLAPVASTSASFGAAIGSLTPSESLATPSGPLPVVPLTAGPTAHAPRAAWPLYAVIAGAALVGSIAVMIL